MELEKLKFYCFVAKTHINERFKKTKNKKNVDKVNYKNATVWVITSS